MKITSNKRFSLSDFAKEQQAWIAQLTGPLNQFIEQVTQSLTQGLTLRDNMKSQTWEIKIAAGQTYPIKQSYTLNEKPTTVIIGNVVESTGAILTAAPFCQWVWQGNRLDLSIIGLNPAKSYTITITAQV
jgi:hypothetical protein